MKAFLALIALIAALVAAPSLSTPAQAQPCQWNYSMQPGTPDPNQGVATAFYCGNVTVNGTINPLTGQVMYSVANVAAMQALGNNSAILGSVTTLDYGRGVGGGARYTWVASSTATPNPCTVFQAIAGGTPIATGRWIASDALLNNGRPSKLNVLQCGAVFDGAHHPLSSYFGTLAAAQGVYSQAIALTDEVDGIAVQAAICVMAPYCPTMPAGELGTLVDYGGTVQIPVGKGWANETIYVNAHVTVEGLGGFQTYAGSPTNTSVTNAGVSQIAWNGPYTQANSVFRSANYYISTNPALSGTATGGSATTIAFNASGVPGINANTFVGSVVNITGGTGAGQSRLIVSGAYAAPTYTATVIDPFNNGNPSGTSVFNIAANVQGQRYTAPEGVSGTNNCNSGGAFNITLAPGLAIKNLSVVTTVGAGVGIQLNCAPSNTLENLTVAGFDVAINEDASYYFNMKNINTQHKYIGVGLTNDNWGTLENVESLPLVSGGAISRMTSNYRPWFVGAAGTADPTPTLNTNFYAYAGGSGIYNFVGGDAEQTDRGVFSTALNITFNGFNIENQGLWGATTGQLGIYVNGTHVQFNGGNWGAVGSLNLPVFTGATPYYVVNNLTPQSGQHVKWFDYTKLDFTFGGSVVANNVTPGDQDTQPPAGTPITWNSYPKAPQVYSVSANQTFNHYDIGGVKKFAGSYTQFLDPSPTLGEIQTVQDGQGDAGTNNIVVNGNGHNIDGAATKSITTNYGAGSFQYDGAKWNTLSLH